MRPYRIVDEAPDDDDEYPRVVRIGAGGRSRSTGPGSGPRYQPWTPRDMTLPVAAPHAEEPPRPLRRSGLTRTQQLMIASFVIICVGMVLGMVLVRVWDDASRAVATLPAAGGAEAARSAGPPAASASQADSAAPDPVPAPSTPAPPAEPGAVTTEIRVLQPNYTVAPGDTLGNIARKHGSSLEALASINNLENRNSLSVGQKLIIP